MSDKRKTPQIRFKGFDGDWKRASFCDIAATRRGLIYNLKNVEKSGVRVLRSSNINEDIFTLSENDIFVNAVAINIEYANKNDILITSANGSSRLVGKHALINIEEDKKCVHGGFMLLAKSKHPFFLNATMSSAWYNKFINENIAGGNGAIGNLSKTALDCQQLNIPNENEQEKIGLLYNNIDNSISLEKSKYEKLLNMKSALLEKMFPQDGEEVPEIRFAGFDKDWKLGKLKELAEFSKGRGYVKGDLIGIGSPIILYGRLYTKYETVISTIDTFVKQIADSVFSNGGEVIVPASGETAEDISRASVIDMAGVIIGGDINIIRLEEGIQPIFFALTISNGEVQKEMSKLAQGKSVVHLHNFDLQKVVFLYPLYDEQAKIGLFFKKLDNIINLQKSKLEKLDNIKKAMLEKMFV